LAVLALLLDSLFQIGLHLNSQGSDEPHPRKPVLANCCSSQTDRLCTRLLHLAKSLVLLDFLRTQNFDGMSRSLLFFLLSGFFVQAEVMLYADVS